MPPRWSKITQFLATVFEYLSWTLALGLVLSLLGFGVSVWPPLEASAKIIWVALFVTVTVLFCVAAYRKEQDDRRRVAEDKAQAKADRNSDREEIRQLTVLLSESRSVQDDLRRSLLDSRGQAIAEERKALQVLRDVPAPSVMNLDTLNRVRNANLADVALATEEAAINEAKQKINKETQTKLFQQEAIARATMVTNRWLPVFDYVVRTLHSKLEVLSAETGEKITSDFPAPVPSIHGSQMLKDGLLVNGKHRIQLGSSPAWLFQISIIADHKRNCPGMLITVESSENVVCILTIGHAGTVYQPVDQPAGEPKIVSLILTGRTRFATATTLSDYSGAADASVNALIAHQHMEFPLQTQSSDLP